jgi:hypothetical protein
MAKIVKDNSYNPFTIDPGSYSAVITAVEEKQGDFKGKPVDELAIARLARHVPKQQMIAVAYKGGTIKLYMTGEWFDKMFNQF